MALKTTWSFRFGWHLTDDEGAPVTDEFGEIVTYATRREALRGADALGYSAPAWNDRAVLPVIVFVQLAFVVASVYALVSVARAVGVTQIGCG